MHAKKLIWNSCYLISATQKFQKILVLFHHASRDNPNLAAICRQFFERVVVYIYKMSGIDSQREDFISSLFVDFESATMGECLDEPPHSTADALVHFFFLEPVPTSVWTQLPICLHGSYEDEFASGLPSLTRAAHGILLNSQQKSIASSAFTFFPNYDRDTDSCATRLLRVLGYLSLPLERFSDISKVGMWPDKLATFVSRAYLPGLVYDNISFKGHTMLDCAPGGAVSKSLPEYLCTLGPLTFLAILELSDHVCFVVKRTLLDRINQIYSYDDDALVTRIGFSRYLDELELLYPNNSGRAGAKVFVSMRSLEVLYPVAPIQLYILKALRTFKEKAERTNLNNDVESTFAKAAFLLFYLTEEGPDIVTWLGDVLNNQSTPTETNKLAKYFKTCHAQMRLANTLPNRWLFHTSLDARRRMARLSYGLDTIIGRSELLKLDFPAEQLMRMHDPFRRASPYLVALPNGFCALGYSSALYHDEVKRACIKMASTLLKEKIPTETFKNYFQRRFFWAASGGAPGAKVTWADSGEQLRLSKRGAMLAVQFGKMTKILEKTATALTNPAVSWSVKALKYESGKLRAILNTILEHYFIQGYITEHVDSYKRSDGWYSAGHSLSARLANSLRRLVDLHNHCAVMFDFSDFNINHTFLLMAEEVLAKVDLLIARADTTHSSEGQRYQIESDLRRAALFVVTARYNTWVSDHDTGLTVRTRRSLQSGERDTSRVNTDSNEVADIMGRAAAVRLIGADPSPKVADKTGDDVFKLAYTITGAVLIVAIYNLIGQAGQPYKIKIEYNDPAPADGEYLRLDYNASARTIAGYPIRAMMGLIHGEFFSDPIPQPLERAAAFLRQAAKLKRRGWTIPERFLRRIINDNARLVYTVDGNKKIFSPNLEIVQLPACLGGVGTQADAKGPLTHGAGLVQLVGLNGTRRKAVCIPSGEGRALLALQYPTLFVNHTELVIQHELHRLREEATRTGSWDAFNSHLVTRANLWHGSSALDQRCLLTWSPTSIPQDFAFISLLLKEPPGLRANLARRREILANSSPDTVIYFKTRHQRNAAAIAYAAPFETAVLLKYRINLGGLTPSGASTLPVYRPPAVRTDSLTSRMDIIGDFSAAHALNVPKPRQTEQSIVQSSLTGAWPKRALNESLASYASELDTWQRQARLEWRYRTVILNVSPKVLRDVVKMTCWKSLGISHVSQAHTPVFKTNDLGFPAIHEIRHSFDGLGSLTKPLGCSIDDTAKAIVSHYSRSVGLRQGLKQLRAQIIRSTSIPRDRSGVPHAITLAAVPVIDRLLATRKMVPIHSEPGQFQHEIAERFWCCWVEGNFSFIPPQEQGLSSDLVTFARDMTLYLCEQSAILQPFMLEIINSAECVKDLLLTFPLHLYALERLVTTFLLDAVQEAFPGVHIAD